MNLLTDEISILRHFLPHTIGLISIVHKVIEEELQKRRKSFSLEFWFMCIDNSSDHLRICERRQRFLLQWSKEEHVSRNISPKQGSTLLYNWKLVSRFFREVVWETTSPSMTPLLAWIYLIFLCFVPFRRNSNYRSFQLWLKSDVIRIWRTCRCSASWCDRYLIPLWTLIFPR